MLCIIVQERLPESLPGFTSLQALFIHSESLLALPSVLGRLTRLRTLDCTGCTSLPELPDSLGSLSNLATLRLDACLRLKQLPDSLTELHSLQKLTLGACATLQVIDLPASAKMMSRAQGSHKACPCIALSFTAHRHWLLMAALRGFGMNKPLPSSPCIEVCSCHRLSTGWDCGSSRSAGWLC